MTRIISLILLITLVFTAAGPTVTAQDNAEDSALATELEPTVAQDWMQLVYTLVRDHGLSAPEASRIYAYTGIALYEAIVPGIPGNFSMSGSTQGMPAMPWPEQDPFMVEYDWITSANVSMAMVLSNLFTGVDTAQAEIEALREQYIIRRTDALSNEVVEQSAGFGEEVGSLLVEWIAVDNYDAVKKKEAAFVPDDSTPWAWVYTREGPAVNPYWGEMRPFGLRYAEVCEARFNIEYSTDPDSTFYAQAREVLETTDRLTDEQREIARFWIDTPGVTGAPAGHWVMIGVQIIDRLDLPLSRAGEMFALMNMALADSFISAWVLKYTVNLLRPVTYIQANIRRNWNPYLETPLFPEYPSGHSVTSGAAARVLTTMFGQVSFTDRTPIINGHENIERSFTSFQHAASEAAISRLYGGIHYRVAIENGLEQGQCVGDQVLDNVLLRSVPQGE
jgi:hypothetical protein